MIKMISGRELLRKTDGDGVILRYFPSFSSTGFRVRSMNRKKFLGIWVGIAAAVCLCGLMLYLFLPRTVTRVLSVSLDAGESRICYYVPGTVTDVRAGSDEISCQVSSEPYGEGTLLYLEVHKEQDAGEQINSIRIEFRSSRPRLGEQEPLTEGADPLQWTGEYAACAFQDPENGYSFGAAQEGIYNTGHYYVEESSGDRWKTFSGYLALIEGIAVVVCLPASWAGSRRWKRRNRTYGELDQLLEQYEKSHPMENSHPEILTWIRKGAVRKAYLLCGLSQAFLWFVAFLCLDTQGWGWSAVLFEVLFFLVCFAAWVTVLTAERVKFMKKLNPISDQEPLSALWYYACYEYKNTVPHVWNTSGLNYAVLMMKNQNCRESALLADRIWYFFGNAEQGNGYLCYHYTQFRNYHSLGDVKWERYHLERAQREAARLPKDSYYREISGKIREILKTEGDAFFEQDRV